MQRFASGRQVAQILLVVLTSASISLWAADMTPEEVVAKHLTAIGTPQARNAVKSRVVLGQATYHVLVGGSGAIDGKSVIATEGQKSNFLFKVNTNEYRGEQFICDGDKISVTGTYSDKSRSEFGTFVLTQDALLRENLLGGVWSSGWPLLDIELRKAKLRYEGSKKLDGRELLALRYQPKKSTDLDILLLFDPQTYQHVMSLYRITIRAGIGTRGETSSAQMQETRYRIEERFSDFQAKDGLTLPTHYDLRYTLELDNGFSKSVEWEVKAINILNNESIDAHSFQTK
jgi:hypothetical protein